MCSNKRLVQYLAVASVAVVSLSVGFNLSWPSPILPLLMSDDSPIGVKITLEEVSWITSITTLGLLFANTFLGQLQDFLGRKRTLLFFAIPLLISWILIFFARSFEILLAGRFLNGLAIAVPAMTAIVYVGEICEPEIRGKVTMAIVLMFEVGIMIITALGSYTSYKVTAGVAGAVPVIFVCIFWIMPESPYFYLRKGDIDNARSCLQKLRMKKKVDDELMEMSAHVEKEMNEKSSIRELLFVPKYRRILFIGLGLKTLQQMSGAVAINTYMKFIFDAANSGLDASTSIIICTSISLPSVLVGSYLIDKMGRKPLYFISTIGCSVALAFEFVYFLLQERIGLDVSNLSWLPITGIILYNIFRTLGVNALPLLMINEVFPTNIKAIAQNLCLIYNCLLAFVNMLCFPLVNEAWGIYTSFGIYMSFCLSGVGFVYIFVPETKGKTFGNIQKDIELKILSNKPEKH